VYWVTGICDRGHTEMAKLPKPPGELPQFWKIPGMDRAIGITEMSDWTHEEAGSLFNSTGLLQEESLGVVDVGSHLPTGGGQQPRVTLLLLEHLHNRTCCKDRPDT